MWSIYGKHDVVTAGGHLTYCSARGSLEPDGKNTDRATAFAAAAAFYRWGVSGFSFLFPFWRGSGTGEDLQGRRHEVREKRSPEKVHGSLRVTRAKTGLPPQRQSSISDNAVNVYPGL